MWLERHGSLRLCRVLMLTLGAHSVPHVLAAPAEGQTACSRCGERHDASVASILRVAEQNRNVTSLGGGTELSILFDRIRPHRPRVSYP